MESYSDRYVFLPAERQAIDQRVAKAAPEFSSSGDIAQLFSKPFSA